MGASAWSGFFAMFCFTVAASSAAVFTVAGANDGSAGGNKVAAAEIANRARFNLIIMISVISLRALGAAFFQVLERSGPVFTQQTAESPVGQQLSTSLAARAIVGFVRSVADPLNLRPAARTRFP